MGWVTCNRDELPNLKDMHRINLHRQGRGTEGWEPRVNGEDLYGRWEKRVRPGKWDYKVAGTERNRE